MSRNDQGMRDNEPRNGDILVRLGPKRVKIPVYWSVNRLGDLALNSGQYGANEPAENYDESKCRYIRISDINEDGTVDQNEKMSVSRVGNEKYILEEGDFLLARTGDVGLSYLFDPDNFDEDCVYAGYLIRYRLDKEQLDPNFLSHYAHSYYFQSWVDSVARSTTLANINAQEYCNLPIITPPISEQRNIADILSNVDKEIQQTDSIIRATEELKRGLMQDLLTNGIDHERFKEIRLGPTALEIPEDWECMYFDEAIELNPSYPTPDIDRFDFLPMGGVNAKSRDITYWETRVKEDCTNVSFKNGDTVYAKITPCAENGKIALIEGMTTELGYGSTEFLVFKAREGLTVPEFVFYLANFPTFRSVTISLMEGSTARQRIPTDIFRGNLKIPIPPIPEQKHITDILSTVDEKIRKESRQMSSLKELKRGLMQDLLTGKVQVT